MSSLSFAAKKERLLYKEVTVDLSPNHDGSDTHVIKKKRKIGLWISLVVVVALVVICCLPLKDIRNFFINWTYGWKVLGTMFVPNKTKTWAGWASYLWGVAVPSIWSTFEMCFLATLFGALISVPLFYLSARNVAKHGYIYWPVRIVNDFLRTIPTLVLAIIVKGIFSYGALSGIVTMTIFTVGIMYKMMYEYIETLDMSPFEAISATGGNTLKCIHLGLAPSVMPMFLSNFLYTLEINIRASMILGYVGCGGFGAILQNVQEDGYYDEIFALLLPLFIVVIILQVSSNILSRRAK